MAVIDGRESKEKDIILQMRDAFRKNDDPTGLSLEVLVSDKGLTSKIRAFAKMSGYESEVHDRDGYFEIRIFGTSCRCG